MKLFWFPRKSRFSSPDVIWISEKVFSLWPLQLEHFLSYCNNAISCIPFQVFSKFSSFVQVHDPLCHNISNKLLYLQRRYILIEKCCNVLSESSRKKQRIIHARNRAFFEIFSLYSLLQKCARVRQDTDLRIKIGF